MVVANAGNLKRIWDWMETRALAWVGAPVEVHDRSTELAQLAFQGPRAEEVIRPLVAADLSTIGYYRFLVATVAGIKDVLISRNGYTGEDGFEIYVSHGRSRDLWRALLHAGRVDRRGPDRPRRARHAAPGDVLLPLRQRAQSRRRARSRRGIGLDRQDEEDRLHRQGCARGPEGGGPQAHDRRFRGRGEADAAPRPGALHAEAARSAWSRAADSAPRSSRGWGSGSCRRSWRRWARSWRWMSGVRRCPPGWWSARSTSTHRTNESDAGAEREGFALMNVPKDCRYTKEHEWVRVEGESPSIGITDYAQSAPRRHRLRRAAQGRPEAGPDAAVRLGRGGQGGERPVQPGQRRGGGGQRRPRRRPQVVNQVPYGDGWMIRRSCPNAAQSSRSCSPRPTTRSSWPGLEGGH